MSNDELVDDANFYISSPTSIEFLKLYLKPRMHNIPTQLHEHYSKQILFWIANVRFVYKKTNNKHSNKMSNMFNVGKLASNLLNSIDNVAKETMTAEGMLFVLPSASLISYV